MERVLDPADPTRCKGVNSEGQCWNRAEEGSDFCRAHNGVSLAPARNMRQYLLTKVEERTRLAYFAEHDEIKSLRDEIALTRMLIEKLYNSIQNHADLLTTCGPLNRLLLTVERLVKSSHQIEQSLGNLLGRPAILRLGQQIVEILMVRLETIPGHERLVDSIIDDLVPAIQSATNETENVKAARALSSPEV
jgi:hypothetical protein